MLAWPVERFSFQLLLDAGEGRVEDDELVLEGEAVLHEFCEPNFR
jgi:hypothetical protein